MVGKPFKPPFRPISIQRGTIGKPIRKMSDLGRAVLLQDEPVVAVPPIAVPAAPVIATPAPPNPAEVRLVAALRRLIAQCFTMYLTAHAAHWNIEGKVFPSFHEFFGGLYGDVFGCIDPFAEAIRQHGAYAPTSFAEALAAGTATPSTLTGGDPAPMIAALLSANTAVMDALKDTKLAAVSADDSGLANTCDDRLAAHLRHDWMLKSMAK